MKGRENKAIKYLAQIIVILFIVIVVSIFTENTRFFSIALVRTFSEPPKTTPVEIDTISLKKIVETININKETVVLINK